MEEIKDLAKALNEKIENHSKQKRKLEEALWKLQEICEHVWVYSSTDYHKGEDYYSCKFCGKKQ